MARGRRILIVEDDPYIRDVVGTALRGQGYDVTGAARVAQGLEAARAARPHLLICDVVLPDGSGVELARTLRGELPAAEQPIVVLMSAFSKGRLADQRTMKEACGAIAFLSKPFAAHRLLDLVAQHLPLPSRGGADVPPASRNGSGGPAPEPPPPAARPPGARSVRPEPPAPAGLPSAGAAARHPAAGSRTAGATAGPASSPDAAGLFATLGAAWRKGWSGSLTVSRPSAEKRIVFEGGRIVWGTTSLTDERLGRVVLRLGWLPPEEYEPTLQEAARTGRRHGEVLVARGFITPAQLEDALREQIEQLVIDALGWPEATYRLQASPAGVAGADRVVVSPVPRLVLRAFREVVSADRLDAYLAAGGGQPLVRRPGVPAAAVAQLELAPQEEQLLAALETPSSLEQVLAAHPGGPEAARPLLAALIALRLVEPAGGRGRGAARGPLRPTVPPAVPLPEAAPGAPPGAGAPASDRRDGQAAGAASARLLEAEALFDAGRRAAENGDLRAAQAALERAVALRPDEGEYLAWAAWVGALAARAAFDRALDQTIARLEAAARLTPTCMGIFELVERVLRLRTSRPCAEGG